MANHIVRGQDILEFDLRRTKDDILVLFHDPNCIRVCGINISIETHTFKEIQDNFDVEHMYTPDGINYPLRGIDLKVPTLTNVFDTFLDKAKGFNLEIKEDDPRVAELLVEILKQYTEHNLENRIIISSKHCNVNNYFRKITNHEYATSACELEGMWFLYLTEIKLATLYFSLFPPSYGIYIYIYMYIVTLSYNNLMRIKNHPIYATYTSCINP